MVRKFKNSVSSYNYYAKLLNKQLEKLSKEAPESRALERYKGEFEELAKDTKPSNTTKTLSNYARKLYKSGALSLNSERRSKALAINKINDLIGEDVLTSKNFNAFFKFVDDARARGLGSLYTSTQLVEAIKQAKNKGLTADQIRTNIQYWEDKYIKYDKDGKMIEPYSYKPLKVISGKRLENYRQKAKDRVKREAKRGY